MMKIETPKRSIDDILSDLRGEYIPRTARRSAERAERKTLRKENEALRKRVRELERRAAT